ncbi:MAG: glycosyltransferase family 9 protein [Planctomycetota bacterium]|jgi:ADP-heptose:LPS heptosyltransferase
MTPPRREPLRPDLERTLVVMIDHHLGNFCLAIPVIHRLATYFAAPPDLLVNDRHVDLVGLLGLPSRVIPASRLDRGARDLAAYAGLFGTLAARRYRAVVDIGGSVRSASLTVATVSRLRIGEAESPKSWVYNWKLPSRALEHTFDRYASMLRCIGDSGRPPVPRLRASAEARARVAAAVGGDDAPLAVIHPGAGKRYRLWPAERFAATADELRRRRDLRTCIIGAPSERDIMDDVRSRLADPDAACCLSVSLVELVALFERASVLVCNESGPMHLAALTDLPVVALFGPSPERVWSPVRTEGVITLRGAECAPGCGKRVCEADSRCLLRTTVETVVESALSLLDVPRAAAV